MTHPSAPEPAAPAVAPCAPAPWHKLPLTDRNAAAQVIAAVQQEAAQRHITLDFAAPPEPTTCCGRGCNGCVWEGFFAALHYWREAALHKLTPQPGSANHLG